MTKSSIVYSLVQIYADFLVPGKSLDHDELLMMIVTHCDVHCLVNTLTIVCFVVSFCCIVTSPHDKGHCTQHYYYETIVCSVSLLN